MNTMANSPTYLPRAPKKSSVSKTLSSAHCHLAPRTTWCSGPMLGRNPKLVKPRPSPPREWLRAAASPAHLVRQLEPWLATQLHFGITWVPCRAKSSPRALGISNHAPIPWGYNPSRRGERKAQSDSTGGGQGLHSPHHFLKLSQTRRGTRENAVHLLTLSIPLPCSPLQPDPQGRV